MAACAERQPGWSRPAAAKANPKPGNWVLLLALLGCAIAGGLLAGATLGGCSTARQREEPPNLFGNLRYRDSATLALFARSYRSGSLYQDFRPVLLADAIALDLEYRRHYVEMLKQRFMLSDADSERMLADSEKEFDGNFTFLLFLFGGTNRPVPINQPNSPWRVLMQDDDGQLLTPERVEALKPEGADYQYLTLYFYGMDRWAQVFRVTFAKLEKSVVQTPLGPKPVELILTGLNGSLRMAWKDAAIFYRPGVPPTAPAASATASKR